jgi:phosphoglycerate dehydrogenase-like enzyme
MSRPHVLITAPFDPRIADELADVADIQLAEPSMDGLPLEEGVHADLLPNAEVIVCELDRVGERTLDAAPKLGLVVSCRAAPVNIDLDACARRRIPVTTTPGRNADVTADLTMALLLTTVRHTARAETWLRNGSWDSRNVFAPYRLFRGIALNGRVLGVIGCGAIGRRVAQRARGFGMNVLVHDPYLQAEAVRGLAELVPLDELLRRSDVVSLHAALNEQTRGLLGPEKIGLMRKDAYLINAGRAALVDETALVSALTEKRIAGAGFDVFWEEPLPANHPVLALDNVTVTPHIAGASDDVVTEHSKLAAKAIHDWAAASVTSTPEALPSAVGE